MLQFWVFLACQTEEIEPPPVKEPVVVEEEEEEEVEEEENSVPVIKEADFTSLSPKAQEELRVKTTVIDQDGDRVRMDYEWSVNGKSIPSERRAYLAPSWFKTGDRITVRVVASDSKSESDTTLQTTIQNTPPKWVREQLRALSTANVEDDVWRAHILHEFVYAALPEPPKELWVPQACAFVDVPES